MVLLLTAGLVLLVRPLAGEGGAGDWDFHPHYRPARPQPPRRAQARADPGTFQIDAALLRQVLEDPVLLQAVDPAVLQQVLVQAATANLLTIPKQLSSTTSTTARPPAPLLNPQPLLPYQALTASISTVDDLPLSLAQLQVDLPNLEPDPPATRRPPRRTPPTEPQALRLDTASLAQAIRDHPDIAAELAARLQQEPGLAADLGLLPPVRAPATAPPPACPLATPGGVPCGPGLAYSPLTRACEWPDTLMEAGCNPEAVTGFGPCPQDPRDPHLTRAQVATWPRPKFPPNPAVISLHGLSPEAAQAFFIVCTPTRYGKLFPRLTSCPGGARFDPSAARGCPAPPAPPPPTLAPPVYGSPDPLITHIGAPLPPGASKFGGFPSIIQHGELHGPSIEFEFVESDN